VDTAAGVQSDAEAVEADGAVIGHRSRRAGNVDPGGAADQPAGGAAATIGDIAAVLEDDAVLDGAGTDDRRRPRHAKDTDTAGRRDVTGGGVGQTVAGGGVENDPVSQDRAAAMDRSVIDNRAAGAGDLDAALTAPDRAKIGDRATGVQRDAGAFGAERGDDAEIDDSTLELRDRDALYVAKDGSGAARLCVSDGAAALEQDTGRAGAHRSDIAEIGDVPRKMVVRLTFLRCAVEGDPAGRR